jgi:uncharacterized membrane protein
MNKEKLKILIVAELIVTIIFLLVSLVDNLLGNNTISFNVLFDFMGIIFIIIVFTIYVIEPIERWVRENFKI